MNYRFIFIKCKFLSLPSRSDKIDYIVQVAKENGVKIEYKPRPFLDKIVGNRPHQVRP